MSGCRAHTARPPHARVSRAHTPSRNRTRRGACRCLPADGGVEAVGVHAEARGQLADGRGVQGRRRPVRARHQAPQRLAGRRHGGPSTRHSTTRPCAQDKCGAQQGDRARWLQGTAHGSEGVRWHRVPPAVTCVGSLRVRTSASRSRSPQMAHSCLLLRKHCMPSSVRKDECSCSSCTARGARDRACGSRQHTQPAAPPTSRKALHPRGPLRGVATLGCSPGVRPQPCAHAAAAAALRTCEKSWHVAKVCSSRR